jgi:hypothetical protein
MNLPPEFWAFVALAFAVAAVSITLDERDRQRNK